MHGGQMIDSKWMVELNRAMFGTNCASATPACDDTKNIFKGTTNTGDGQWQGQFIGPTDDDAMPSGVVRDVMRLAELVHYHADVQFEHPYPLDGLLYWLSR